MSQSSHFAPISEPQPLEFGTLDLSQISALYAAGIVNPFGPTLAVLATECTLEPGTTSSIIRLSLNPFAQDCDLVGEATLGDSWNPFTDLPPFLNGPLNGCPSLLLPHLVLDEPAAIEFFARYLSQFDDGSEFLKKVKRFPNDPWNRIQADIDGPKGALSKLGRIFGRRKISDPVPGKLDEAGAHELASLLLDEAAMDLEFKAFMTAWEGAIQFQSNTGLAAGAMPLQSLVKLIFYLGKSCRIPKMMLDMLPDSDD